MQYSLGRFFEFDSDAKNRFLAATMMRVRRSALGR